MSSFKLALAALALPLASAACSAAADAPAASATQEISASWLAANLPAGSPAEAAVLALANDPTMSMARYVSRCGFSESQAAAIVSYRAGDEPASSSDDQVFDSLAELDALPFTDAGFWSAAKTCATSTGPFVPFCISPPVIIELVVDESGSMAADGKWLATRDALLELVAKMNQAPARNVSVGALRFSTEVGKKVAPRPFTSANHYDDLVDLFDTATAFGGGTATHKALAAAYRIVKGASTDARAKRVVVLLSDGIPQGGTQEQADIVELLGATHAEGIKTFSVGIGAFPATAGGYYDPAFMGLVAVHGGTAPAGCDPAATVIANVCHHQITPGDSTEQTKKALIDSFDAIRAAATATACP